MTVAATARSDHGRIMPGPSGRRVAIRDIGASQSRSREEEPMIAMRIHQRGADHHVIAASGPGSRWPRAAATRRPPKARTYFMPTSHPHADSPHSIRGIM